MGLKCWIIIQHNTYYAILSGEHYIGWNPFKDFKNMLESCVFFFFLGGGTVGYSKKGCAKIDF